VAVIDFHALGQVIWVSLVAGIAVTILFSVVIWGADKAAAARRVGEDGHALAYVVLSVAAMVAFAATVIIGVAVMLNKP